jgi:hypothetical protein
MKSPAQPARPSSPFRFALALAAALAPLAACDAGAPLRSAADRPIGRWEAHAVDVFDDDIEAAALQLELDAPASARSDAFLRERAQTADFVGRVRVQTVTVDKIGDDVSYHLVVKAIGAPLAASRIADIDFELNIKPTGRAYPLVKLAEASLRGKTFIGFVQRYATADGDPEVHFHLAADKPDVAAAVKEAVALTELSY